MKYTESFFAQRFHTLLNLHRKLGTVLDINANIVAGSVDAKRSGLQLYKKQIPFKKHDSYLGMAALNNNDRDTPTNIRLSSVR